MNKIIISTLLISIFAISINAENNVSVKKEVNKNIEVKTNKDINHTLTKSKIMEQEVKEQMEREKKYAQEQSFAQGDDYDLKAVEVNEKSLDSIPVIEPDYDFDITDVYRDDI
jgi:hypothetical protein